MQIPKNVNNPEAGGCWSMKQTLPAALARTTLKPNTESTPWPFSAGCSWGYTLLQTNVGLKKGSTVLFTKGSYSGEVCGLCLTVCPRCLCKRCVKQGLHRAYVCEPWCTFLATAIPTLMSSPNKTYLHSLNQNRSVVHTVISLDL